MDVVALSRIQFALTSAFHYLYPPLSIGLGLMLVFMEGAYLKTKNPMYKDMAKFWTKIFALTFALGVATGLVQVFGFGTNWARYSRFVGDVFGSALAAEGVFAFFLEAGFLGVMLFGWERVSAKTHYMATVLVALGAHFSSIWIVVVNSWMQTPTGYKIVGEGADAKAVVTDFWQMILNPSAIDRIIHVVLGCWLTGIFLIISVSAYYLLKRRFVDFARACLRFALPSAAIVLVLQLISADSSARIVATYQPAKLAAMEGLYETQTHAPLGVIGWVDTDTQTVKGLQIPGLLSFLVHRDVNAPVQGLNEFPKEEWPNVAAVFQTYHLMIFMWSAMVLGVFLAIVFWKKKALLDAKWTLRFLVASVAFPQIANQVGWMTAEMGRQPWIVYKMLRVEQGVSASIQRGQVVASLWMFSIVYLFLFAVFIYLLDNKIKQGPHNDAGAEAEYRDVFQTKK